MAYNGCLQIICIIAAAFLALYLLQNMSGRKENFDANEYDVSPNQRISNSVNMPKPCGCSGACNCGYVPPSARECTPDCDHPPAPTCPRAIVPPCGPQEDDLQQLQQASCFPRSQLSPDELLPQSDCNVWSQNNPQGDGSLADRNFLQAGWATGISSVGSTNRNANLQLRSEPPNVQVAVSPWMQSTINPDIMRKPLEVGGCA